MKKASWFLFFLLFGVSCLDDPDCFLLNNDVIGISFRVMGSSSPDSFRYSSFLINDQEVEAGDTVDFKPLLLDRNTENLKIGFLTGAEMKTIDVSYLVKVQFVSEECGPRYIYSDLNVTNHNFARLEVVNNTPGRDGRSLNIVVSRCPQPDTVGMAFFQLTLPATGAAAGSPIAAKLNSVTVNGATQYYVNDSVSTINLPVDAMANQTNYVFDFADNFGYEEPVRNLSLTYKVTPEIRFEACGTQRFVDSLRVGVPSGTAFDRVSVATESDGDLRDVLTDPETTNINIYRCPPTNRARIAFQNVDEIARSKKIIAITNDYNSEILYADTTMSRVELPLNTAATSTTFNIQFEDVTETIVLNYSWSAPRQTLFSEGSACLQRPVIIDLGADAANEKVDVVQESVLFPAVTNVTLEVAD